MSDGHQDTEKHVIVRASDLRRALQCACDYDERLDECEPEAYDRIYAALNGEATTIELRGVMVPLTAGPPPQPLRSITERRHVGPWSPVEKETPKP